MILLKPRQAGFSIAETLVAIVIGAILIAAVASYQAYIANETKVYFQKLQSIEFKQDLSTALAKKQICECNTAGLKISADPTDPALPSAPKTFSAVFPIGRKLYSSCPGASSSGITMAQAGDNLPHSRYALQVTRISVSDLTPVNGNDISATQFVGAVKVEFDNVGIRNPNVRQMQPIKVLQNFYVKNGEIVGCGAAPREISYHYSATVNNDEAHGVAARAECPPDTRVINGGWTSLSTPPPAPGCTSPRFAEVSASGPDVASNAWIVVAKCRAVQAIAVCYKPTNLL